MIILGLSLLVLGFFSRAPYLVLAGVVLALAGEALYVLGITGHAIAGRRHYW